MMSGLLILTVFLSTILGRVVLGAALGITGLMILVLFNNGTTEAAAIAVYGLLTKFSLSAIPIFLVMGEILTASGLSNRVYESVAPLFRRIPGKLVHTNIFACALFGAVSGSSTATAAAVSSVSYPQLSSRGYNKPFVIGSLAAGGTLGLLIPPSLPLIVYGAWQEVSIGALFLGGVIPGIMIALLFSLYIGSASLSNRALVPEQAVQPGNEEPSGIRFVLRSLFGIWPFVVLMGSVLGTIYLGLATLTESASLGVVMAILLGFFVGDLTPEKILHAVYRAMKHFGVIAFVFMGAAILSQAISVTGFPRLIIEMVSSWGLSKYGLILIVTLLYLSLGCIFEGVSLMLLTLPFLFPVVVGMGFDPVWFGIYVTIMVEVGLITPPVGLNLYFLSAISGKEVPMGQIAKSAAPYFALLLLAVALIVIFPKIVLLLPQAVY